MTCEDLRENFNKIITANERHPCEAVVAISICLNNTQEPGTGELCVCSTASPCQWGKRIRAGQSCLTEITQQFGGSEAKLWYLCLYLFDR